MDNSSQKEWSRRRFIVNVTGAGTAMMLKPLAYPASNQDDPRVAEIVARTIGIDTHNHIDVPLNVEEFPGPKVDMVGEMKKSGLSAICMTFAVDYQRLTKEGEAYERFLNALNAMDEVLRSNNMKRALTLTDLQAAHKNHLATVIQSVEGGHFLEGKLDRLGVAYGRGLRQLGLLHDSDASVPLGDVYTNPARWGGLTAFGADVIRECNKMGILADLTHCSNETINAALKVTTHPVIISHTGLDTQLGGNQNMAKMMRPRLISKEQAKIVANAGGIIGVWTHLSDTPLAYAQNIRAMADVIGVDHVCIGTDTKMTPSYRSPGHSNSQTGQNNASNRTDDQSHDGNNANHNMGDGKNPVRVGERTNEAWQNQQDGFYFAVVRAMLQTGFNEEDIRKIGGGNFCRIFEAATSGH
ncbi:MAG TPA: membrane dipeptidase [Puia sp.]|nr:membrane dipeptidase [Puia sp.]